VGSNPAGEQIFFRKSILFACMLFKTQVWQHCYLALLGITSTHRNVTLAKLNAHHLGTRICWLLNDSCFRSFITAHWKHWCREKTVNGYCTFLSNHVDKQWLTTSAVGRSHPKPNFFSVSGPFWSPVITLLLCHMQAGADCILNIFRQYWCTDE